MERAINELEIRLETISHNGPIYRAEGNIEQADLNAATAASIRKTLEVLRNA